MNLRSWKNRFYFLVGLMIYGSFDPRYYLWIRKMVTRKSGTIIDTVVYDPETGEEI